jgi:hypothetical protein
MPRLKLVPSLCSVTALVLMASCAPRTAPADPLTPIAVEYVKLALAVGRHDGNYVDAYYGPKAWQEEAARGEPVPVPELLRRARSSLEALRRAPVNERTDYLEKQLVAVEAFLRRLSGERMSLSEEARLLYDIDPPRHGVAEFDEAVARLDALLPGTGSVGDRSKAFRDRFDIPADRLEAVLRACLEASRERTFRHVKLPPGESFELAIVRGKPWGAYNWYLGNFRSRIEVNTDLPVNLLHVFGTIAHEGYPGHHAYNALIEEELVRGRGWVEYTVSPLYSPTSLLAEGTANVGADLVMDDAERVAFQENTLAPLAGLQGLDFDLAEKVRLARRPLDYVSGEAARLLLDEETNEDEVVAFIRRYELIDEARAKQSIEFIRGYRAYEFNYTEGEDLVKAYVGTGPDANARFYDLLQRPMTPSGLRAEIRRRAG